MSLSPHAPIAVVGAGTMGQGIAQVAATFGHPVALFDSQSAQVERAKGAITKALQKDVEKGRLKDTESSAILSRLRFVSGATPTSEAFGAPELVIEAIIEDLQVKQQLFQQLESFLAPTSIIGTNTSSLSVTAIAAGCKHAERVVGIHFFNPATLMPLVEIVPGMATSPSVRDAIAPLMLGWKKKPVVARDTPGFIVNRIARPFYGESLRLLEEGIADIPTIDWAMKELGGFRMGPFELMDLIGNDVNFKVTCSVFESFFYDPRYRPSLTQKRMVEAQRLGRKSGRGYYDYAPTATPPTPTTDQKLGGRIVERVLAMLMNEAIDAVYLQIASPTDIETAMTAGVNYPKGLLAWADSFGLERLLGVLDDLQSEYREDRYRASPLLRTMVREKRRFFS